STVMFFFSSRRRHTRWPRDWSSDVCSSDLIEDQPDLRILEDRDFIRRRGGSSLEGEREYAFKHAITREVAYESVPKAKRAHLHRSEERRVGKECRRQCSSDSENKTESSDE